MRIIPNDLQQSVGQFGLQCGNTQVNKQFVQDGRLKFHLKEWEEITSNKFILDVVQGYVIEFISVLIQSSQPKQPKLEKHEEIALNALLEGLLQKRVIEKCAHEAGEFISPVFLGPKKNGKYRMILNLKNQVHLSYPLQDGYTSIMYQLNDKELLYGLAGLNRCILFSFHKPRFAEVFEISSRQSIIQIYYIAKWFELCTPYFCQTHETSAFHFANSRSCF